MNGLPLRYVLRSLLARRLRSALTAAGVAMVVFIAVLMLGLSRGLLATTAGTADPNNLLVLSYGAESMEFSAVEPADLHVFAHAAEIARRDGEPLASPEVYLSAFVDLPGAADGEDRRAVVRGVRPVAFAVHARVRIVEGGPPGEGGRVIVGRLAATKLGVSPGALAVGRELAFEGPTWRIAGIFEAPGTVYESEIWAHLDDVMVATRREDYSSVTVAAVDAAARDRLLFDLGTRTDIRVQARAETEYYAAAAAAIRPLALVMRAIAGILVLGGVLVGMNTMFTSILGRTRELAVLVVRGYRRPAILAAFLAESMCLALAGGAVGCLLGLPLDALPLRVPMGAFRFAIDGGTLAAGMGLAAAIGLVGALGPLAHVARKPLVDALRGE